MILVRTVMQARFGKASELAAAMSESIAAMRPAMGAGGQWRILTDLTGPFDTVVLESQAESMAEWERLRAELFALPEFAELFARTSDLIVSGRNELYTIEAQG